MCTREDYKCRSCTKVLAFQNSVTKVKLNQARLLSSELGQSRNSFVVLWLGQSRLGQQAIAQLELSPCQLGYARFWKHWEIKSRTRFTIPLARPLLNSQVGLELYSAQLGQIFRLYYSDLRISGLGTSHQSRLVQAQEQEPTDIEGRSGQLILNPVSQASIWLGAQGCCAKFTEVARDP